MNKKKKDECINRVNKNNVLFKEHDRVSLDKLGNCYYSLVKRNVLYITTWINHVQKKHF